MSWTPARKPKHTKVAFIFMTTLEKITKLCAKRRSEVDELIHCSWSFESAEAKDVELLVERGDSVNDPLDVLSTHVLVRSEAGKLIGYGRVAIIHDNLPEPATLREIEGLGVDYPAAYISRLVVHPAFRGRGIATMIHQARLEIAADSGALAVYGWAVGDKPRTSLAQLGFEEIKVREGFETAWYRTSRATRLVKFDLRHYQRRHSAELRRASY